MKNIFKKIITCTFAVCLIMTAALAGACDNKNNPNGGEVHIDPTTDGYKITVLYPDNTPVKGSDAPSVNQKVQKVGIQLVDAAGNDINGGYAAVNEYGTAKINYRKSGEFFIDVYNCPTGFDYVNKVTTVAGRGDYTVKLSAIAVSYTINIKLPDGSPASNIKVTLKQNGNDIKSATTGTDGKVVISDINSGTYDIELTGLPEGVSYLPVQVTSKTTNLNIELINLHELKLDEEMSAEKLAEWDAVANSSLLTRFDRTAHCYDFTTVNIPEGKKVYYYFTADEDGEYKFISKGKYYNIDFYGTSLNEVQYSTSSTHESTNTCEMVRLDLLAGQQYYFAYSIPGLSDSKDDTHELSGVREFMIAKPVAGVKHYLATGAGEYTISFDMNTAMLEFKSPESATPDAPSATDGGIFEIRSATDKYDVKLEYYAFLSDSATKEGEADDISDTDKNFSYTVTIPPSYAGNSYYFKIIIKSKIDGSEVDYDAGKPEVTIIITRTGNAKDNFSPVIAQHASATEKYGEQEGTFRFLLGTNDTSLSEDQYDVIERDGGYYVKIDNVEHELVVAIKKNIGKLPYSYTTIEYMGGGAVSPGGSNNNDELPSKPSATKQNSYLSLYTDPAIREDENNPKLNFAPFIEEYALLCNSDGVYKLNSELKNFLIKYYVQHGSDLEWGLNIVKGCWLVSCGYYA